MSDLDYKFNKYLLKVKELKYISDENKLFLYGNYKQAIEGDINIKKPPFYNIVETAKWNAWNSKKGLSREKAIRNYINRVKELFLEY
jgi:acyl-CoA-binding protein